MTNENPTPAVPPELQPLAATIDAATGAAREIDALVKAVAADGQATDETARNVGVAISGLMKAFGPVSRELAKIPGIPDELRRRLLRGADIAESEIPNEAAKLIAHRSN